VIDAHASPIAAHASPVAAHAPSLDAWRAARRVLCIRLDGAGDLLMTTPAIRALKHAAGEGERTASERHVTVLTSTAAAPVARLVPEIDDVLTHDAPWMKHAAAADPEWERALAVRLAAARFDAAVVFTVYSQSALPAALLCWLADVPLRLAHCRENPYRVLTDWVRDHEPERGVRHEVRRQLDLVATVGAWSSHDRLSLRVPDDARVSARELTESAGLDGDAPWVALHPGATAASRRYPPEHFAAVGDGLAADGHRVVFLGAPSERDLVDEIRARMNEPSVSFAGMTSVAELAAVIARAPLLVANNSGPAHIAAAVGTPIVQLYALTNPQHTPWRVASRVLSHDVPCRGCLRSACPLGHHACLRDVAPADVVDAVRELHPWRRRTPNETRSRLRA
jgi:lipopolysaccharide heptosyltransferase II